mmetsp:Transcript_36058/g.89987  ORF Transcript_36058/g.89987 Transcript_36058/m.89987 type:complete len:313 (+) Transcript_36058:196-1134(+)
MLRPRLSGPPNPRPGDRRPLFSRGRRGWLRGGSCPAGALPFVWRRPRRGPGGRRGGCAVAKAGRGPGPPRGTAPLGDAPPRGAGVGEGPGQGRQVLSACRHAGARGEHLPVRGVQGQRRGDSARDAVGGAVLRRGCGAGRSGRHARPGHVLQAGPWRRAQGPQDGGQVVPPGRRPRLGAVREPGGAVLPARCGPAAATQGGGAVAGRGSSARARGSRLVHGTAICAGVRGATGRGCGGEVLRGGGRGRTPGRLAQPRVGVRGGGRCAARPGARGAVVRGGGARRGGGGARVAAGARCRGQETGGAAGDIRRV